MTENVALQAVVAALKYGPDIALATVNAGWKMTHDSGALQIHLYPGAGQQVAVSPPTADLLRKALQVLSSMPPDEDGPYGTSKCNLTNI